MEEILYKYLPHESVIPCFALIKELGIYLKIVNERQSRHGDYQRLPNGQHKITINANLNKYRFLMTLIHEIAHLVAIEKYGRQIKPHGNEWKLTYQGLMQPFLRPEIFPTELLSYLVIHFQNPSASSDTDVHLSLAMQQYDTEERRKHYLQGASFVPMTDVSSAKEKRKSSAMNVPRWKPTENLLYSPTP